MNRPLWDFTARELSAGYAAGTVTPSEVLAQMHRRIDEVNPELNAVIAEDRSAARRAARDADTRWRAGAPLSPLDGVPMTIKDNLICAGLPATWGSALHGDGIAERDEAPVARLRAAGAVFLGKTNVPEFTLQGFTSNALFGTTTNPHTKGLTPGGSTGGGAAAVAAGLGPIAIGTDGGGSLRRPAAHCGLYAHKPSVGQIARYDGFPEILGDFEVVGPIARSAEDLAMVFDILSSPDPRDPASMAANARPAAFPAQLRIAYLPELGAHPVDTRIAAACARAVAGLGALGHEVTRIDTPYDYDAVSGAWSDIAAAGLAWHLRENGADRIGENARGLMDRGALLSATDLLEAQDVARAARREAGAFFAEYDLLVCPSAAALAWPADRPAPDEIDGQLVGPRGHAIFTAWMNVAGLAAINLPLEMTEDGGGIGMQLVAPVGYDRALLAFAQGLPDRIAAKRAILAHLISPIPNNDRGTI